MDKDDLKEADDSKLSDAELEEKIEQEINEKMVADVDSILNPVEESTENKDDKKEDESGKKDVEPKEDSKKDEEDSKEDSDKKGEEDKSTPLQKMNLPDRLLQAAKRNQLSDEEVVALGSNATNVLTKLADRLDAVSAELGEFGRKKKQELTNKKKELPKEVPTLKLSQEDLENPVMQQVQEVYNALADEVKTLRKLNEENLQKFDEKASVELSKTVDAFFDTKATDYPEFGNSKTLTRAEVTNRLNVWDYADDILLGASVRGETIALEDALGQAFSIYATKHPNKKKEKLENVKKREEQLLQRPNSKKVRQPEPSNDEKAVKAVKEVLNRGRTGWE